MNEQELQVSIDYFDSDYVCNISDMARKHLGTIIAALKTYQDTGGILRARITEVREQERAARRQLAKSAVIQNKVIADWDKAQATIRELKAEVERLQDN